MKKAAVKQNKAVSKPGKSSKPVSPAAPATATTTQSPSVDEASGSGSDSEDSDDGQDGMEKLLELLGEDAESLAEELKQLYSDAEEEQSSDAEEEKSDDSHPLSDEEDSEEEEDVNVEEESQDEESEEENVTDDASVNNAAALDRVLKTFKLATGFFDTQTLTSTFELDVPDASNDLERELQFYKQSLWAANNARALFLANDKPFTRPADYFAEMVKSDDHMERVRVSLLNQHQGIKASEEAKRLRYLKKYGKKVQVAKLQERQKEKRDLADQLKEFKKKRKGNTEASVGDEFDITLDDADDRPSKRSKTGPGGKDGPRMPRQARDSKYGRPQTSRRPKQNTRESTNADILGGGKRPRTDRGNKAKRAGKAPRPGKSKRQHKS